MTIKVVGYPSKLTKKFGGKQYRFGSYHESKKHLDRYIEDMPNFKYVFNYRIQKTTQPKGYVLWVRQK